MSDLLLRGRKLLSRRGLYRFLDAELATLPKGARVLNVGAGGEVFDRVMAAARPLSLHVTSTDVDPERAPDIVDDITRSTLADESFDAVVIMEVLEHVMAPQAAADEVLRILKPGGRLILSTPFIFPIHDRPYDFFRYTKFGLRHLFRSFEDVRLSERDGWAEAMLVLLARAGVGRGRAGRIVSLVTIPLALALLPLARGVSAVYGNDYLTSGYVLSARRPSSAETAAPGAPANELQNS